MRSDHCATQRKKHHLQHFLCVFHLHWCGLGHRGTFGRLLFGPLSLCVGEVVDGSKLDEGREDKGKADGNEPVHRGGVRDLGEGVASTDTECRHGQDGGNAFDDSRKRQRLSELKSKKISCTL